jgi:hypothetical protein
MSKSKLLAGAVLALALTLVTAPAWAHEEISPPTVTTGRPTFLTVTAANEKKVALNKLTLTAPAGLPFGAATHEPSGWTVQKTATVITWSGGSVAPEQFEQWGFEIEGADQPGALGYKVTLGFADGSKQDVNVVVTAVAAGASPTPTVTSGTGASVTTVPATTATTVKKAAKKATSKRANVALGLGAAALVLSVVALATATRAGRRGPAAGGAPSTASGEARDW